MATMRLAGWLGSCVGQSQCYQHDYNGIQHLLYNHTEADTYLLDCNPKLKQN